MGLMTYSKMKVLEICIITKTSLKPVLMTSLNVINIINT